MVGTGVEVAATVGSWVATVMVGDGVGYGVGGISAGADRTVGTGVEIAAAVGSAVATVMIGDGLAATGGGVEAMGVGADNPTFPVHPANKSTS